MSFPLTKHQWNHGTSSSVCNNFANRLLAAIIRNSPLSMVFKRLSRSTRSISCRLVILLPPTEWPVYYHILVKTDQNGPSKRQLTQLMEQRRDTNEEAFQHLGRFLTKPIFDPIYQFPLPSIWMHCAVYLVIFPKTYYRFAVFNAIFLKYFIQFPV